MDTVILSDRAYIKSLEIPFGTTLKINEGAELIINDSNENNHAAVLILGSCINEGRLIKKNSLEDGLLINGNVTNSESIEINQVTLKDIKIMSNGSLVNLGAIRLNE